MISACLQRVYGTGCHTIPIWYFYLFFPESWETCLRLGEWRKTWGFDLQKLKPWVGFGSRLSQAWKASSFIVSNLSCPEEKELRVLSWSSSSAIWGSDLSTPLPNCRNPESGMDIDLVRVMAAAFCFWVACTFWAGLGGGWVEGRWGNEGTINLAGSVQNWGLYLSIPISQPNLLFRNYIRHLHLSLKICYVSCFQLWL